jgi:hypothetical protein
MPQPTRTSKLQGLGRSERNWGLLLADWLDNTGDIFEHMAEYPKAACRRLWAHYTHDQGQKLDRAEAARAIESIENFANGE